MWQEVTRVEFEIQTKDQEYGRQNILEVQDVQDEQDPPREDEETTASATPVAGGMLRRLADGIERCTGMDVKSGGRTEQTWIPPYDRTASAVHLIILTEEGGHNSGR